jgi:predicted acylesterase/phospholipase RssA
MGINRMMSTKQAMMQNEASNPPPSSTAREKPPHFQEQKQGTSTTSSSSNTAHQTTNNNGEYYYYFAGGPRHDDDIYQYMTQFLLPAIFSSIPILMGRLLQDFFTLLLTSSRTLGRFILPSFMTTTTSLFNSESSNMSAALSSSELMMQELPVSFKRLWESIKNSSSHHAALAEDHMLSHFDTNGDGHISSQEIAVNLSEFLKHVQAMSVQAAMSALNVQHVAPPTWWAWFAHEWPLMDWKLGVFLWRTFGGILLLLATSSIVPGALHGWTARLLRWPVLGLIYFLVAVELVVYTVIRLFIRLAEYIVARPKHRKLRRCMAAAKSYEEWDAYATELDKSQKRDVWLQLDDDDSRTGVRYNWTFIRQLMKDMRAARRSGDDVLALAALEMCTRKNVGGIMSEDLFSYSNSGQPKKIVSDFLNCVVTTMHWVTQQAAKIPIPPPSTTTGSTTNTTSSNLTVNMQEEVRKEKDRLWKSLVELFDPNLRRRNHPSSASLDTSTNNSQNDNSHDTTKNDNDAHDDKNGGDDDDAPMELPGVRREQVLSFLKRARAAYGRTALCLSGGAMMGLYHFGHVLGLMETGTLPHIISGTSAGSIIAAIVCTRTDEELRETLTPQVIIKYMICFARPWGERIKSLWRNGNMFDFDEWAELIKWFTNGDMTFEEAYHKTGRVFCITLSSTTKKAPPVLLNYLSAPHVTIASAVLASAAVPGFIPPVSLQYKDKNGLVRGYTDYANDKGKDQTYFDGSIRQDIPIAGLAEMLNCQFFVACQCNPHVVPFFFNAKGGVGRPSRWSSGAQEHSWRGGFLLAALEMYLKVRLFTKNLLPERRRIYVRRRALT